jgi:hypothetical protein
MNFRQVQVREFTCHKQLRTVFLRIEYRQVSVLSAVLKTADVLLCLLALMAIIAPSLF